MWRKIIGAVLFDANITESWNSLRGTYTCAIVSYILSRLQIPPMEVWIEIIRSLNFNDTKTLGNTCKYFEYIVENFGLLKEKVLDIVVSSPQIFKRNMSFLYKDVEVGSWLNCWGTFPFAIQKRNLQNCHLLPNFSKLRNRVRKVHFYSHVILYVSIQELFELLETLKITNTVEDIEFECANALYLMTSEDYLFPVKKGPVVKKSFSVSELNAISNVVSNPFGNAFIL